MVIFAPGASDSFSLVPSRRAPFPPAGRSAPHLAVGVTDAAVEVLADNAGLQADGGGTVAGGPHVLGSVPLRPQGWWLAAAAVNRGGPVVPRERHGRAPHRSGCDRDP